MQYFFNNFKGLYFDSLRIVFPLNFTLVILYVQFSAAIINLDVYSFRELVIYFSWLSIFSFLIFLSKSNVFSKIFLAFISFLGLIELVHLVLLRGPITTSSIFILLNTNLLEATDFLYLKWNFYFLLLIPYFIIIYFAFRSSFRLQFSLKPNWFLYLLLGASLIFLSENIINNRFVRKATPNSIRSIVGFYMEYNSYNSLKKRDIIIIPETQKNFSLSQISVIIIGESLNRNHMSIYGYHRKTNPRLEMRDDIFVFNDVISPYSNTLNSVLSALTESNIDNKKPFHESISLIDVFHSAGFHTSWLSNQSPIGVWDNGVFNIAQISDQIVFVNTSANSSFESTYSLSLDDALLKPLNDLLNQPAKNKLIIIHLMGNHSDYSKRYPSQYQKYTSSETKKQRIINEYDNAVLYNDFIIDSVFNILKFHEETSKNTLISAIYFSDHGENVYDINDKVGHDYVGRIPNPNVEIPFIVWVSSNYTEIYSNLFPNLTHNVNKPFMLDDLFHSALNLSGLSYKDYEPNRSLFSSHFNFMRKRILEDGYHYSN